MSHDIFISYSDEDRSRVEPLVRALQSLGYGVWMDTELQDGDVWLQGIYQAVHDAKCVLAICTKAAERSKSMQREAALAFDADKLIPVLVDQTPPPHWMPKVLYIDLTAWDGDSEHASFQRLKGAIAALVGIPLGVSTTVETETPPRPTRRLRVPDIAWVEIPDGPFIYQDAASRHLPTFWIARYPITNAQYRAFIDDGGYDQPRWWKNLERPEPRMPRWPQPNRPRTDVGWYECVAFGRWLTARLGLADGSIRLPTELEWEKAARGERGLAYPWGNEYRSGFANVNESLGKQREKDRWSLNQTTAVGLYPQGRSPYGVEDLAGTVWEWCLNRYEVLEAVAPDTGGALRGLRGGAWIHSPDNARAVARNAHLPDFHLDHGGFRLVSAVPMELSAVV